MDMRKAFDATIELARERDMQWVSTTLPELGFAHIVDMRERMPDDFSEAKLGRWLGWAQAAVVAAGCGTLEEMKQINKRFSGKGV